MAEANCRISPTYSPDTACPDLFYHFPATLVQPILRQATELPTSGVDSTRRLVLGASRVRFPVPDALSAHFSYTRTPLILSREN
jgi:hypothetical protein